MRKFTTALLFMFFIGAAAQTPFGFESFTETYQDLEGATSLNNGEIWDDPNYTIPLGFTFALGEETFDTVYIVEDGAGGALSSDQVIDGGSFNVFLPVVQDIIDRGDFTGEMSLSNISHLTEGEEGSRIAKIEYNNVGFFEDGTGEDFLNFQVWLYEESGFIEYRYGESSTQNPEESYEGETGLGIGLLPLINGDFELLEDGYLLINDPAAPDFLVLNAGGSLDELQTLDSDVPENTVYRFSPTLLGLATHNKIEISFYPNPVIDELQVLYQGNINSLKVYNAGGKQLLTYNETVKAIDMSALAAGFYILKANTDDGPISTTVIKK